MKASASARGGRGAPVSGRQAACGTALAVLAVGTALAAQSSPGAFTAGGGRSATANAVVDASMGSLAGVASTAPDGAVVLKPGFIGQLREVTGLALTANPGTIGSGRTTQLSGVAALDDDTFLVLAGSDIAWAAPTWPLDFITADGLASAAVVETYVAAPFTGTYLGVGGQGSVLVVAPPSVITLPASEVVSMGSTYRAQLDGLVNPHGFPTTAWFEWGARTGAVQFATAPLLFGGTNEVPLRAQLENLPVAAAYEFRVVASNGVIGVVWGEHRLFGAPPFIVEQPFESQWPVEAGTSYRLTVQAIGTGRLEYQWRKDGLNLATATQPSLVFASAQPANSGAYSVVITNDWGAVTSRVVRLTVMAAPVAPEVVNQPANQVVAAGGTLRLSVEARGDPPLAFHWRKNTVNLDDGANDDPLGRPLLTNGVVSGAATPSLVITDFQPADAGTYSLVVQNNLGVAESRPVRVRLAGAAGLELADGEPAASPLLTEPAGVRVARTDGFQTREGVPCLGGAPATMGWLSWRSDTDGVATFTTAGSGYDTALAVYDGRPVADSRPVGCDDDGAGYLTSYQRFRTRAGATYWLAVAGALEARGDVMVAWSSEAALSPPPLIVSQPQGVVTEAARPREFAAVLTNLVEGDVLQWRRNGTNLTDSANVVGASTTVPRGVEGSVTNTLTLRAVSANDVGVYSLLVSRSGSRNVETAPAVLELRAGAASEIASEYKRDVLLRRILESRDPGFRSASRRLGGGQSPSAGTVISDNFRPAGQGGTPQTLVIGGRARWCYVPVTADGFLTVETTQTTFDPVLQVWATADELTWVLEGEDDNGAPDGTNALVWLFAHTTKIYLAVVDGVAGASGQFSLQWSLETDDWETYQSLPLDQDEFVPPGYGVVDTSPDTQIGKVRVWFGDFPDLQPVRTFSDGTSESPPTHVWFPIATRLPHLVSARPVTGAKEVNLTCTYQPAPPPELSLQGGQIRIHWLHPGLKLQTAERGQGPWLDDLHAPTLEGSTSEIVFGPDGVMRLFRVVPDATP